MTNQSGALASFIIGLILFGSGESTKIAVAAFGAALAILFATAYGVMNARKQRQLAARVMGASRLQVLSDVTIWERLPQTFVGMRSGVSLALVIVIVAEMFIGSDNGLGHRIIDAQQVLNVKSMYAAILAAGALGYLVKTEEADMIVEAIRAANKGESYISEELDLALTSGNRGDTPRLSAQERRVMALYGAGEPVKAVAFQLGISEETAKSYLKRIREKYRVVGIDVGTKVALRKRAIHDGILIETD